MTSCCSLPVDDNSHLIEISAIDHLIPARAKNTYPNCGEPGKAVDQSTLKSMLSSSLRTIRKIQYFFCRTTACPVVYFRAMASKRSQVNRCECGSIRKGQKLTMYLCAVAFVTR